MKLILKLLGATSLWSLVVGTVFLVDPVVMQNILIPDIYLPFVVSVFLAVGYTVLLITRSFWLGFIFATLTSLTIILSILKLMYWFVWLGIILFLSTICYIHFSQLKSKNHEKV